MRTAKETVRLIILIFSAFLSVAIQIFLYVRKYNKELNVFRMLGMSWWGIYEISLFGHICNVGIGAIGMYILLQNNGILASFGFDADVGATQSGWYATIIFFSLYLMSTALVFRWIVRNEEQKKERYYAC